MTASPFAKEVREKYLLVALDKRILQVLQSIKSLDPAKLGNDVIAVSEIKNKFSTTNPSNIKEYLSKKIPPPKIPPHNKGCLENIMRMALGDLIIQPDVVTKSNDITGENVENLRSPGPKRFSWLTERYNNPLNILFVEEEEIVELILFQLMVPDRRKLDSGKLNELNIDELFLKLNLLSIKSANTQDLRFLDALNYYFERISFEEMGEEKYPWLKFSFLSLYLRGLGIWAGELECV